MTTVWGKTDPPLTEELERMNKNLPLLGVNKLREKFIIESYNFYTNNVVTKEGKTEPVEFVHMIVTTESGAQVETRTAAPLIMKKFRQPPEVVRGMIALRQYTRYVHVPGTVPGDYGYWVLE